MWDSIQPHIHACRWNCLPLDRPFVQYVHMYILLWLGLIIHHTYMRACCLFEGELWATDGYLINKFPLDHSVFMLRASHSTSVLQSLMCFSQLSCFPLMWPKMTCGLSGKMVSAQDDELPFYLKISVGTVTNKSIKNQKSGHISHPLSYLKYVGVFFVFFNENVKHLRFGWLYWLKDVNHKLITGKLPLTLLQWNKDRLFFQNVCVSLQSCKLTSPLSRSFRHKHRQAVTHSFKLWLDFIGYRAASFDSMTGHDKSNTVSCKIPAQWFSYLVSMHKTNTF